MAGWRGGSGTGSVDPEALSIHISCPKLDYSTFWGFVSLITKNDLLFTLNQHFPKCITKTTHSLGCRYVLNYTGTIFKCPNKF